MSPKSHVPSFRSPVSRLQPQVPSPRTKVQGLKLLLIAMALLPASLLAAPGDENWDDRFGPLGVDGNVNAIAVNGTNVYVGGAFTRAGGSAILRRWLILLH